MRKLHSIQPAFTLLEILLAIALVSLLMAALSASLFTAFAAQRSTADIALEARQGRSVFAALQRDLWCAAPPTGVLAGAFVGTDERSGVEDADRLTFFTTTDPTRLIPGGSDLMQVTYRLIPGGQLTHATAPLDLEAPVSSTMENQQDLVLVRETTGQLLASESMAPTQQVLGRGVRRLNLRYHDGSQWLDAWDSTVRENQLPQAVEITLEMMEKPTSDPRRPSSSPVLMTIVALPGAPVAAGETQLSLLP